VRVQQNLARIGLFAHPGQRRRMLRQRSQPIEGATCSAGGIDATPPPAGAALSQ
jgi:hypothetical protein